MKFYKVSLDQFSKDYAKANGLGPIGDWSEEDRKDYIYAMNNVLYNHIEKMDKKEIKLIKERIHYGN